MEWFGISKPTFTRGDVNGDGEIDIADVVFLLNYLFLDGPEPFPLEAGDADSSGEVDIADVVYLLNYLFINGPSPSC
ncbi:MAG: dockerin type I repeat-containing protein [candidate division Zixibacteria bacterium]|nr:dockerin type I repeat-containing protein [candidate division Zixibacteria bacterium]